MYTVQTQAIVNAILQVPKGRVDTYGHVALRAGYPGSARQVVRILSQLSEKESLPWHRIVNRKGEIALSGAGGALQEKLLENESIEVIQGKVDLKKYAYY